MEYLKNNQFMNCLVFSEKPICVKPRNKIVELKFNPQLTNFNINDYIKQSKKSRRSEKLEIKLKPTLHYGFMGKIIRFSQNGLSSSFLIRNIISLVSFEMSYMIYSPLISSFVIRELFKPTTYIHYKRSNQYYLRKVSPVRSRIVFSYVTDTDWTKVGNPLKRKKKSSISLSA